jgi:hypothetical protein
VTTPAPLLDQYRRRVDRTNAELLGALDRYRGAVEDHQQDIARVEASRGRVERAVADLGSDPLGALD